MARSIYYSRLGERLRARGLTVADLRRRLASRRVRVSRRALDRMVSLEPIATVSLGVVVPVLEELGLRFEDAFRPADPAEAAARTRARASAKRIAAGLSASGGAALAPEVEDELDEVIARSAEALRARRPDLFDTRGRLRRRALARAIEEQLVGPRLASAAEYAALTGDGASGPAAGRPGAG